MTDTKDDVELPQVSQCPDCSDHDEDCDDLLDKVNCWLYAPERGMCPYLRAGGVPGKSNDQGEK